MCRHHRCLGCVWWRWRVGRGCRSLPLRRTADTRQRGTDTDRPHRRGQRYRRMSGIPSAYRAGNTGVYVGHKRSRCFPRTGAGGAAGHPSDAGDGLLVPNQGAEPVRIARSYCALDADRGQTPAAASQRPLESRPAQGRFGRRHHGTRNEIRQGERNLGSMSVNSPVRLQRARHTVHPRRILV